MNDQLKALTQDAEAFFEGQNQQIRQAKRTYGENSPKVPSEDYQQGLLAGLNFVLSRYALRSRKRKD